MRDIRADLRERLDSLAADKARLMARAAAIESQIDVVQAMLRAEEDRIVRSTGPRAELPFPPEDHAPPGGYRLLGTLIKAVMRNKNRPLAMEEIRDEIVEASAFDFADKKPGRSIHFGLVSLQNGGEVAKLPDGRWELLRIPHHGVPVQEEAQIAH